MDRNLELFATSYDPAVQRRASWAMQEQLVRDAPTVVMNARQDAFAYNSDLKNFHPNQVSAFDDAIDLDI